MSFNLLPPENDHTHIYIVYGLRGEAIASNLSTVQKKLVSGEARSLYHPSRPLYCVGLFLLILGTFENIF
jgi:hypothetical protein